MPFLLRSRSLGRNERESSCKYSDAGRILNVPMYGYRTFAKCLVLAVCSCRYRWHLSIEVVAMDLVSNSCSESPGYGSATPAMKEISVRHSFVTTLMREHHALCRSCTQDGKIRIEKCLKQILRCDGHNFSDIRRDQNLVMRERTNASCWNHCDRFHRFWVDHVTDDGE
jgi:hypothetical protein